MMKSAGLDRTWLQISDFSSTAITGMPPKLRKKFGQSPRRRLPPSRRLHRPPIDDDDFGGLGSGSGFGPRPSSRPSAVSSTATALGDAATRAPWRRGSPSDTSGSGLGAYLSPLAQNMTKLTSVRSKSAGWSASPHHITDWCPFVRPEWEERALLSFASRFQSAYNLSNFSSNLSRRDLGPRMLWLNM